MWFIQHSNLVLLLFAFMVFDGCRTAEQRARISELQILAQEIPKFPDFQQVHYADISKPGIAVITYYYKSPSSFESVKAFYRKELSNRGWTEEEQEVRLYDSNGPITFRRGNSKIVLTRDDILTWQYTIDFSWRE